jgi:hypothetical protein
VRAVADASGGAPAADAVAALAAERATVAKLKAQVRAAAPGRACKGPVFDSEAPGGGCKEQHELPALSNGWRR